MTDLRERQTYVASSQGSSGGAWLFGIIVALLVAVGVWYFASMAPSDSNVTNAPATQTEQTTTPPAAPMAPSDNVAPSAPADTAPAAPAETAPAAPSDAAPAAPSDTAPATPAPAQ